MNTKHLRIGSRAEQAFLSRIVVVCIVALCAMWSIIGWVMI